MPYDILTIKTSDRTGAGKATPLTGNATNGVKLDNSTLDVMVMYLNDSGSAVVLRQKNAPNIEDAVDGMTVSDKDTVSIANGEMVPLGPWLNTEYGNDDPDDEGLPAGKTILIDYVSGDAGKFFAVRKGST